MSNVMRRLGCSCLTKAIVAGSRLSAGDVMAPTPTCPKWPDLSATSSSCAWFRLASAMRAYRIMVSPYQVGRMPAR